MKLHIEALQDNLGKAYFKVSSENSDTGESVVKTMSYDALLKMLDGSHREERIFMNIGQLPDGYLDAKVDTEGAGTVRLYVPADKRCFLLDEGGKLPVAYHVPFPPSVFEITVSPTGSCHGKVHFVKGTYEEVKAAYYGGNLVEYEYPYGNVSRDGGICMGNIRLNFKNIRDASTYVDAFFDGVTNGHLLGSHDIRVRNGMSQKQLLGFLKGKDEFPLEILQECSSSFMSRKL